MKLILGHCHCGGVLFPSADSNLVGLGWYCTSCGVSDSIQLQIGGLFEGVRVDEPLSCESEIIEESEDENEGF